MGYNEYIANEGKLLLNLNTLSCGTKMASRYKLSIIEVTEKDGRYFSSKYIQELEKLDEDEEKINNLKNLIKEELTVKGYNLDHLVEPIVHGE